MPSTITLDINNVIEEYKLLFIIENEYKYIIYTNMNDTNKLYAIKVKELKKEEKSLPITNEEWEMIESKYQELINNKNA